MERKNYLDNIRWITVVLVMLYHVIYTYNSQGVIKNTAACGYPVLDRGMYFVYPWFMVLLFIVAGISAKYSLQKRSAKEFIKDRAVRLLVPSLVIPVVIGWSVGYITNLENDMFMGAGDKIPGVIKFIIYVISGQGPLWFAQELFIACLVLVLIRKIDKNKKLEALCDRFKWWGFLILYVSFLLFANILNTPLIEVYRNGFYINGFLLGYYVFSNDRVIEMLRKAKFYLVPAAIVTGIGYVLYIVFAIEPHATDNTLTTVCYSSLRVLRNPLTNFYAYIAVLAIFSVAKDLLNFKNKFSEFMTKANFGYYALHYFVLVAIVFALEKIPALPIWSCYLISTFGMIGITTVLYLVISRIPFIRKILLGMK